MGGQARGETGGKTGGKTGIKRQAGEQDKQQLLTGVIDRLVLIYAAGDLLSADIVDFKTDHLFPGDTEQLHKRQAFYEPQLESYRRAVQRMFSLPADRTTARLLFTFSGNHHKTSVS